MPQSLSPFLIDHPRTHRYWWTVPPVLPESANCLAYDRLKRLWFDHTMNTFRIKDGRLRAGNRGFYNESCEDHITVALFEHWALCDGAAWAERLLGHYGIATQGLRAAKWQYAYEERRGREKAIADIVVWFRDAHGEGVLVIEAKKRGGKCDGEGKDHPLRQRYLDMEAFAACGRKKYGLLVDEADRRKAVDTLGLAETQVLTWQQLGRMQAEAIDAMNIPPAWKHYMRSALASRYRYYGYGWESSAPQLCAMPPEGREALPAGVRLFVAAQQAFSEVAAGRMPAPPLPWLAQAPSALEVYEDHKTPAGSARKQSSADRRQALWRKSY